MKYNFLDWGLIREGGLFEGGGLIDHLRYQYYVILCEAFGAVQNQKLWKKLPFSRAYLSNPPYISVVVINNYALVQTMLCIGYYVMINHV